MSVLLPKAIRIFEFSNENEKCTYDTNKDFEKCEEKHLEKFIFFLS